MHRIGPLLSNSLNELLYPFFYYFINWDIVSVNKFSGNILGRSSVDLLQCSGGDINKLDPISLSTLTYLFFLNCFYIEMI